MFLSIDSKIAEIYNQRFLKLGPSPEASMWFSKKRQFKRFDIIFNEIKLLNKDNNRSIIDIGCGYGAFLKHLQDSFSNDRFHYYGNVGSNGPNGRNTRFLFEVQKIRFNQEWKFSKNGQRSNEVCWILLTTRM